MASAKKHIPIAPAAKPMANIGPDISGCSQMNLKKFTMIFFSL